MFIHQMSPLYWDTIYSAVTVTLLMICSKVYFSSLPEQTPKILANKLSENKNQSWPW